MSEVYLPVVPPLCKAHICVMFILLQATGKDIIEGWITVRKVPANWNVCKYVKYIECYYIILNATESIGALEIEDKRITLFDIEYGMLWKWWRRPWS